MLNQVKKFWELGDNCSVCGKFSNYNLDGTGDCIVCSSFICPECSNISDSCNHMYCKKCSDVCSLCLVSICKNCIEKCNVCGRTICKKCMTERICDKCGSKTCNDCSEYITKLIPDICPEIRVEIVPQNINDLCKKCFEGYQEINRRYQSAQFNESQVRVFYEAALDAMPTNLDNTRILISGFYSDKEEAIKSIRVTASFLGYHSIYQLKLVRKDRTETFPDEKYSTWKAEGIAAPLQIDPKKLEKKMNLAIKNAITLPQQDAPLHLFTNDKKQEKQEKQKLNHRLLLYVSLPFLCGLILGFIIGRFI